MAHMPALNVLLDGLQRRRPVGVNALCEVIARVGSPDSASPNNGTDSLDSLSSRPLVAELSLICPVFGSRMRVPGRITGCQHIEAFDMEAFLRREVFWPRLNCPICG
ncbi:unnamed protein product [Protopolystoma xenopodis]|uniref:SP-RING-type domain-containing protein n=1 Tax=Protopolystoma xenopodis TaxID=117903 RepID=A0A3S5CS10_9PLAT|nr:unnamed protein product [Protopolystoma xenopodis]